MSYFSFLIVQHPDKADLYVNGLPIGIVPHGEGFQRHQYTMPDGTKRPIECPIVSGLFRNDRQLKEHLHRLIDQINL